MIGERELEQAIAASQADRTPGGEVVSYLVIGAQLALVQFYATRYAEVSLKGEKPYGHAAAGGFLLGFELGVRAARLEQVEQ